MSFVTVPGQACAVIEPDLACIAQVIDERAGQQGVFERNFAVRARADDMNRTRILPKLFADRAEIDKAGDQGAVGLRSAKQRAGAIGRGQYQGRLATELGRVFSRRIAQIETWQRCAPALAAKEDTSGP